MTGSPFHWASEYAKNLLKSILWCTSSELSAMGTTEYVVKNYLKSIYDKLGLWNRVELALWFESRQHGRETMN